MNQNENFKFSMIGLSWWEELTFTEDENIKVHVVPIHAYGNETENKIEYQGKIYSLSWFVKDFHPHRNPSWSYQGPKFFKYQWRTLLDRRRWNIWTVKRNLIPLSDSQKREVKTILQYHEITHEIIKAVIESIIYYWWMANYTTQIYPYIQTYYPNIYEKYTPSWFIEIINATVQKYTKWTGSFCGKEIFISREGTEICYLKNINIDKTEKKEETTVINEHLFSESQESPQQKIFKKYHPEATEEQKTHVQQILERFGLDWFEKKLFLQAIMESLEAKWWPANYVNYICPYIKTYYPRLYEEHYFNNEEWFKNRVNATLRYYSTMGTDRHSWIEIFVSLWKGTGTYDLKYRN